jgi:hypothetical protein
MAAAAMQDILALLKTGMSLTKKCRFVHAAEKLGAAVAAAQEVQPADSLTVALLQLARMDALEHISSLPGVSAEDCSLASKRSAELLGEVLATVESRKAAGTLLRGTCRGVEDSFYLAFMRSIDANLPSNLRPADMAVGYAIFLKAGVSVLRMLTQAMEQRYACPEAFKRQNAEFVVGVSAVVARECRAREPLTELEFVFAFKTFVDQPPVAEYAVVCSLLRGEWEQLLRTSRVNMGRLHGRRISHGQLARCWSASDCHC